MGRCSKRNGNEVFNCPKKLGWMIVSYLSTKNDNFYYIIYYCLWLLPKTPLLLDFWRYFLSSYLNQLSRNYRWINLELRTRVVTCREIGLAKWKKDDILQNAGKYSGDTEFITRVKFKVENKICKRIICLSIVDMFV